MERMLAASPVCCYIGSIIDGVWLKHGFVQVFNKIINTESTFYCLFKVSTFYCLLVTLGYVDMDTLKVYILEICLL